MEEPIPLGAVIPLFNKRATIVRAVRSVLSQSHPELSLVVVDDGSTDGGAEVLEKEVRDSRLQILHTLRRGPGAARNAGIRSLQVAWVGLLDADDEWHPDFVGKTSQAAASAEGLVAVYTGMELRGRRSELREVGPGVVEDYFRARMRSLVAMSSSSVLLRRSTFLSLGGFREDLPYAEDVEAWFRLCCAGEVYYLPQQLMVLTTGDPTSLTSSMEFSRRAAGLGALLATYEDYVRTARVPSRWSDDCRKFMDQQRGWLAIHQANAGDRLGALRTLFGVPFAPHTLGEYREWCLRMIRPRG